MARKAVGNQAATDCWVRGPRFNLSEKVFFCLKKCQKSTPHSQIFRLRPWRGLRSRGLAELPYPSRVPPALGHPILLGGKKRAIGSSKRDLEGKSLLFAENGHFGLPTFTTHRGFLIKKPWTFQISQKKNFAPFADSCHQSAQNGRRWSSLGSPIRSDSSVRNWNRLC